MESRRLVINGIRTHYYIYEDGKIWSDRKGVFLSPQANKSGYVFYQTTYSLGRAYLAHTLVALMFIGLPPTKKHEINHKDLDKRNNHWSNLEWVTHAYNMRHARKAKHWEPGRMGFKHSDLTKNRMAKKKHKAVRCFRDDEEMVFESIGEFCDYFGTYRKKFNYLVSSAKKIDGWYVRYADQGDAPWGKRAL